MNASDAALKREERVYIEQDLENKVELSNAVVKDVLKGLDKIEEKTGLRDAYESRGSYDNLPAPAESEYSPVDYNSKSIDNKVVKNEQPVNYQEAAKDHENRMVKTAEKHVMNKRERDNLGLSTVNFDHSLKDARLYVWILCPALWHWMYDDAGRIQFSIENDVYY